MTLIIKNKNRWLYTLRSGIRGCVYRFFPMCASYLKLKEVFIKKNYFPLPQEDACFEKIFIETISYCNNNCQFCPASVERGIKSKHNLMTYDLYLKILNELADIDFKGSLAFHCNNEPLLDERLAGWIKAARELLKNNFFYIYTNGICINTALANILFTSGLNRIIVNNYNNTYALSSGVRDILDHRSALKGEVILNYRFKDEYRGNRAGESPNARFLLSNPLKVLCLRPQKEIVVGYDGSVPLCCADAKWKKIMGNAQKSSLRDIWFSDSFKGIRKSLIKGDRSCTEICRVCDALNFSAAKGIRG